MADPTSPMAPDTDPKGDGAFVLLGVGASAGGLEAFQTLLASLNPADDFALILVQHLDPDHQSLLPELLGRHSSLPVQVITDGMRVEKGQVYLIPPAYGLDLEGLQLRLVPFEEPRGLRRPIDDFLEALAREHGPRSAAIILSGTGSDGSLGVRSIKAAGGLVFAQEPRDAKYDGMPRAALAAGAVDMVLPAAEMMPVLRDFHDRSQSVAPVLAEDPTFVTKLARTLRHRLGHDFSGYKPGTIRRRVALRMSVLGIGDPQEYLRLLVQDQGEAEKLLNNLLINVTRFFRDPGAFESLRREVVPAMLEGRDPEDELRIWVAGCSTGQEAYSLAMLFDQEMTRQNLHCKMAIFGTDIDEDALAVARRGLYPNTIASEIPADLLERYFSPTTQGYEVRAELRDAVRFSNQSLIKDPPFAKLDLISCRNLLIYFDEALQDQALGIFHYALRPGGWLLLGPSESARMEGDPFRPINAENRLFQRDRASARALSLPRGGLTAGSFTRDPAPQSLPVPLDVSLPVAAVLLAHHTQPYLLLTESETVMHVGPGAETYLQPQRGQTSLHVRDMILPDLSAPLRRLLTGLALSDGSLRRLEVQSPAGADLPARLMLAGECLPDGQRVITFSPLDRAAGPEAPLLTKQDEAYVAHLETELDQARQTIRSTVEELETSNEELKSSNEEMMSMNEELQSANEELSTTNEELQGKLRELAEVNADLENFMDSTQIATVFLDLDLKVRNFTTECVNWFRFIDQDRGRNLADIGSRLDMATLIKACERVIQTGTSEEMTLKAIDGSSAEVMVRFAVYRTANRAAAGVVFSIFDVSAVANYARAAEVALSDARANAAEIEEIYRGSPVAMGLLDANGRFLRVNARLAELSGLAPEAVLGRRLEEALPGLGVAATQSVQSVLESGQPLLHQRIRSIDREDPDKAQIWDIDWYPVRHDGGVSAVGFNVVDVTRLLGLQADLRRIMRELQHRVKNMLSNVIALVNRAQRDKGDSSEILNTLAQRIRALAHTHNLLTAENWSSTALIDVLQPELSGIYGEDRVALRGPALRLNARSTLAIGMAVHELATNAAKYGAFSVPDGHVSVRWSRIDEGDGEQFVLRWKETGGPATTPPTHEGFGTQLIGSMIEGTLEGEFESFWEPEGLSVVITLPWNTATEVDYDSDVDPLRHADPLP
ncbi:CheR family methyltransferase [Phaeovulum sp. W22_SRMD_FR3]|uniref:CheR family methyltransferase n=1 Tax=Phaeovulum sp. W22_SRMD_FR3 TaxID=3240274 RepID=UPI003F97B6F1